MSNESYLGILLEQNEQLQHFGIMGMKWGVRKSRTAGSKKASKVSSAKRKERNLDAMENEAKSNIEGIRAMKSAIKPRPVSKNPGYFEKNKQSSADRRMKNLDSREAEAIQELKNIQDYRKRGSAKSILAEKPKVGKLSRAEKKSIKQKKNDILNSVIPVEGKVSDYVERKATIKLDDISRTYGTDPGKADDMFGKAINERAKLAQSYAKANGSKLFPKGINITYDAKSIAEDDFALSGNVSYNGHPVNFQSTSILTPKDRALLEPPKGMSTTPIKPKKGGK